MTEGLTDDKQRSFRSGRRCVDQLFNLKNLIKKKQKVYLGSTDLENANDMLKYK